ncbi:MAG TPA: hypothetical protein DIW47_01160 [Bacteroidetes bacterium]|nr:hypothetical protein [Bacteroidota bacterium]
MKLLSAHFLILTFFVCSGCDSKEYQKQIRGTFDANHGYCGEKIVFENDSEYVHIYGSNYSKKSTYTLHNGHVYLKGFEDRCDWIKGGSRINDVKSSTSDYTFRGDELSIGIYEMGFTRVEEN